ncbi:MAG: cation diffusion facilitator family transporter [Candidatus Hermodarchaeota archaeon]
MSNYNKNTKFAYYSFIVILFQSFLKLLGVLITGSLSFLSETVDTMVDIIFVSITIYSVRHSQKPPDYEHMYGHTKTDSIGAMIQGIILVNLYILLIIYAAFSIATNSFQVESPNIGLIILIISFSTNLVFSRILIWQGRRQKSHSLEIQGLNLFQDSMRAIIVLISFIFALYGIIFLDPFFSIILSIWIIISAIKLTKGGVEDLVDFNPVDLFVLEEIRKKIFTLDHVNGIEDLKIRASGRQLYLEAHLSVEDHISVVHAHEITKNIRDIANKFFPVYKVECIIEMNPLGGEISLSEKIINLIYSMKSEFPEIINVKDLSVFRIKENYYLSLIIIVDEKLTLNEAHEISSKFEKELKNQAKNISRIITHIEGSSKYTKITQKDIACKPLEPKEFENLKKNIEIILKSQPEVKGYHGLECWTTLEQCIIELHVFFDGILNISEVHDYSNLLEEKIKEIDVKNLQEVIIHAEPLIGRSDGVFFDSKRDLK